VVAHWTFGNCNAAGCGDVSGNGNNLIYDTNPPTGVAIAAPANGATGLTGTQTVTATCTDTVGISSLKILVDGVQQGASGTSSPYKVSWDTTKSIDGPHSIYATCTNIGGVLTTSPTITASTANSVTAKTVYLDPTSSTDCSSTGNNGLSTSTPCSTLAGVQYVVNRNPLHGGDSILQKAGTTVNIPDLTLGNTLTLAGPSCTSNCNSGVQNVYPARPSPSALMAAAAIARCWRG
jgi:hypothetical protein